MNIWFQLYTSHLKILSPMVWLLVSNMSVHPGLGLAAHKTKPLPWWCRARGKHKMGCMQPAVCGLAIPCLMFILLLIMWTSQVQEFFDKQKRWYFCVHKSYYRVKVTVLWKCAPKLVWTRCLFSIDIFSCGPQHLYIFKFSYWIK